MMCSREPENKALSSRPFREWETIAMKAAKQALEWLSEKDKLLLIKLIRIWSRNLYVERKKEMWPKRKVS
jgi:hypothetical protein